MSKELNWDKATMPELYAVLHDKEASELYRQQAADEIKLRNKPRYVHINQKLKAKYSR